MWKKRIPFAALALWIAACKTSPPIQSVATLEEVMHHMVIPNAEVVWDSVGTIYTVGKVEEIQPRTEEEWLAVEQSATVLTEAGNLLMMEGRAKDTGPWMQRARALREAGASLHEAAKARNVAAVFERGGHLFDACQGCHFQYRFEKDPNTIRTH
jgi:hypothetical protein